MKFNDPKLWIAIAGMILSAGIYIGKLEHRIDTLEKMQQYSHGDVSPWMAQKG